MQIGRRFVEGAAGARLGKRSSRRTNSKATRTPCRTSNVNVSENNLKNGSGNNLSESNLKDRKSEPISCCEWLGQNTTEIGDGSRK